MQALSPMHFVEYQTVRGSESMVSILWHQVQLIGQPFMKTVVRIPGPSSVEHLWMFVTSPVCVISGFAPYSNIRELNAVQHQ